MDGTLHTIDGRPTLRFERALPHPVGLVWRAITEPTQLAGWFPWQVEIDARVGGRIGFTHPQGAVSAPDAVITEWDPPRVFAYSWHDQDLRWALTPTDAGCVLVFTHAFAQRPVAAKLAAGWHVSLDALAGVLAGVEVPPAAWAERNRRYVEDFGLLDGRISGDELRFDQELGHPTSAVWAVLVELVDPAAELVPEQSIGYAVTGGVVRISLLPQDFGVRVVVTQTGAADGLPAAQLAWRATLHHLADELDRRQAVRAT